MSQRMTFNEILAEMECLKANQSKISVRDMRERLEELAKEIEKLAWSFYL